ncbi:protein FAM149A [Latimeria chalumnae]|uniref:protein FAM149A n=1 Tax=Latimeria chalumnae TaxID=7897 RepID=UPI00313EA7EB
MTNIAIVKVLGDSGIKLSAFTVCEAIKYAPRPWIIKRWVYTEFCSLIRKVNQEKRLMQAVQWIEMGETFDNVIFMDETLMELQRHTKYPFRRNGHCSMKPQLRHPYKIHIWGAISKKVPGPIVLFTDQSCSNNNSHVSRISQLLEFCTLAEEFDKANTQKVHQLFWYVDELLFEGKVSSCTQNLQTECSEWTKRSPHLRILGKQLLLPKDEGFQLFQSRANSTATTRSLPSFCESINNVKELSLSGQRLVPTASPLHQAFHSSGSSGFCDLSAYSFLQEEVYDMDGKIEEYFAYDNKEFDDEGLEQKRVHLGRKRNKRGIPPISPNSCMNDTVAAEIFDDVWRDVVEMLEELIRKHWESALTGIMERKRMKYQSNDDEQIGNSEDGHRKVPCSLVSRMQAETLSVPSSRGCDARSISSGSQFILAQAEPPSQSKVLPVYRMMNTSHSDLNGVMTIQAKPLQQRNGGLMEKTQNEHEEKLLSTGSGVLTSVKNRLSRIADHSILSASRVMQTPSRRPPLQRKLPSIAPEQFRSKALNVYSDRVLRGTRL